MGGSAVSLRSIPSVCLLGFVAVPTHTRKQKPYQGHSLTAPNQLVFH